MHIRLMLSTLSILVSLGDFQHLHPYVFPASDTKAACTGSDVADLRVSACFRSASLLQRQRVTTRMDARDSEPTSDLSATGDAQEAFPTNQINHSNTSSGLLANMSPLILPPPPIPLAQPLPQNKSEVPDLSSPSLHGEVSDHLPMPDLSSPSLNGDVTPLLPLSDTSKESPASTSAHEGTGGSSDLVSVRWPQQNVDKTSEVARSSQQRMAMSSNMSIDRPALETELKIAKPTETEAQPASKTSEKSAGSDLEGFAEILRSINGKQLLLIIMMMSLPAGICTIMYCILLIMRRLEDDSAQAESLVPMGATVSRRVTLGEMMTHGAQRRGSEALCLELLAPGEHECHIALPSLCNVAPGPNMERMVVSKVGAPIVRITLNREADSSSDAASSMNGGTCIQERISLVAYKQGNALGFCELQITNGAADAGEQRPSWKCNIHRPTGELFATLQEASGGFVTSLLSAASSSMGPVCQENKFYMLAIVGTGTRFWIQGDATERYLSVVNEKETDKPVVHVEPGKHLQFDTSEHDHYRLRVQPKVDAGVVIMALLAIDRLPKASQS